MPVPGVRTILNTSSSSSRRRRRRLAQGKSLIIDNYPSAPPSHISDAIRSRTCVHAYYTLKTQKVLAFISNTGHQTPQHRIVSLYVDDDE